MDLGLYFRQPVTVRGCGWSEAATKADLSLFLVRLQGGPLLTLRVNGGVYTQGRLGPTQVTFNLELETKVHTKGVITQGEGPYFSIIIIVKSPPPKRFSNQTA